jgi:hypothetical protein
MSLVDDYDQRRDALKVLAGLVDLLANPKAASELIDKLSAAQAKTDEARAAIKQLAVEQEKSRAAMAAELDAHRRALSDERLRLNNEINARRNEVAKAEAAVKAAKTAAEEDVRQADALRADWQRKCDAVGAALRA